MTTTADRIYALYAAVFLSTALLSGCDSSEEKKEEEAAPVEEMSVLSLPVSLRTGSPAPGNAHVVQLAPSFIDVNGQRVLYFKDGEIPASEISGDILPKVKAALSSPSKPMLAFEVHTRAPYLNMVRVLASAQAAGMRNVSFKVRKLGGVADTGWTELNGFKVVKDIEEEVKFDTVAPRPWDDFVAVWDEMYNGCRSGSSGNCVEKTVKVAKGGNVQITLFGAGDGVNLKFDRMGGPSIEELTEALEALPPEERADVLKGMPPEVIEGYMALPFQQSGGFQFRSREAVIPQSPFSKALSPLCGKTSCGVLLKGRKQTLSVRILQMIGAAFPDGTPAPTLAFAVTEQ